MKRVLLIHGPNLNLLGEREPSIYGTTTLAQIDLRIRAEAQRLGLAIRCFQRNGEGEILDLLHRHRRWANGVLINPGAYAHYSYAIRDGLAAVALPAVEVHLTDIHRRERWRRRSVIRPACAAEYAGRGVESYLDGLRHLARLLRVADRERAKGGGERMSPHGT